MCIRDRPYTHITYNDLLALVKNYSNGLIELGLAPNQQSKLFIFASTSPKWMQSFLGASFQNISIVTAYDTLGESGLTHSLVQTESDAIYTENALLSNLIKPLSKTDKVKYIIHSDPIDPEDKRAGGSLYKQAQASKDKILEIHPDIKFISFDEVLELSLIHI